MEMLILAMPPAMPLVQKCGVGIGMMTLTSFLATRKRDGERNPNAALLAGVATILLIVVLEFTFPDEIYAGLDGLGVLAALIGILAGVISAPWQRPRTVTGDS